ncbi:MAG TPA: DUF1772 domain-containing protein, partial [Povalibacter sp.]|nr:DUF1772 domain-containing protein [Povalibacter sp.]
GLAVLLSVVVMPKPRLLFGPNRESESAATRELLHEWAVLHRARTALSVLAAVLMIWKFSQIA